MTHFSSLLQLSGHWNSTAQSPLKSRLSSMEFFPKASGFGLWSLRHKVETHVSSRTYQRRAWVWEGVLLSGWELGNRQNTDCWSQWEQENVQPRSRTERRERAACDKGWRRRPEVGERSQRWGLGRRTGWRGVNEPPQVNFDGVGHGPRSASGERWPRLADIPGTQ